MSEIHASVTDQQLKIVKSPVLASGGVNEVKVVFNFCTKWEGFEKTAIFYRDTDKIYHAILNENDICILPWEVYAESGTFYIGVFGEKGDIRRTSTVVKYKVGKGGFATEDMMPNEPTPDVYSQIIEMYQETKALAQEAKELAQEAQVSDLTEEQNLTDEQKAQVRKNIGIKDVLLVYIKDGAADYTSGEIVAHMASAGTVICICGTNVLAYNGVEQKVADGAWNFFIHFKTATDDEGKWTEYVIDHKGAVTTSIMSNSGGSSVDDSQIGEDAWSSKNTVDKLCPSFTKSGSVVTCEPVEGYPLEVVSHIQAVQTESDASTGEWVESEIYVGPENIDSGETQEFFTGTLVNGTTYRLTVNATDTSGNQVSLSWPGCFIRMEGDDTYAQCATSVSGNCIDFVAKADAPAIINLFYKNEIDINSMYDYAEEVSVYTFKDGVFTLEEYKTSTIRPINGHTSVKLWHGGKNILDTSKIHSAVCTFNEATGLWTTIAPGNSAGYHRSLFTAENGQNGSRDISKLIRVPSNRKITVTINDWSIKKINFTDDDKYMVPTFMGYAFYDGNGNWVTGDSAFDSECLTLTTPNVDPCYLDIRRCTGEVAVSFSSIQIEIGDKATAYEPYRGETFTIDFGKELSNGKNLLPCSYQSGTTNGLTSEVQEDGSIVFSGTPTGTLYYYLAHGLSLPAGTYTFSIGDQVETNATAFVISSANGMYETFTRTVTFTLTNACTDLRIYFFVADSSSYIRGTVYPQLEAGSVATAYESSSVARTVYGGYFNWNSGVLTIDRTIHTLDGTEVWEDAHTNTSGAGTDSRKRYMLQVSKNPFLKNATFATSYITVDSKLLCSKLPTVTSENTWYNVDGISSLYATNTNCLYAYCEAYATDFQGFKEMMKGAQIVFGLTEPITVQLTPQEILALSGVNTLYSDTGDTDVSSKADPTAVIENLQARISALEAAIVNNA